MATIVDSDDENAVDLPAASGLCVISHGQQSRTTSSGGDVGLPLFAMAQPVLPVPESQVPPESDSQLFGDFGSEVGEKRAAVTTPPPKHQAPSPCFEAETVPAEIEIPDDKPENKMNEQEKPEKKGEGEIPENKMNDGKKDQDDASAQDTRKRKAATLDPRAVELLHDPKFAKGTRMGDLSPGSQKLLSDVRVLRARENSTTWHQKFEKKGIPKTSEEGEPEVSAGDSGSVTAAGSADPPQTLKDARVPWLH